MELLHKYINDLVNDNNLEINELLSKTISSKKRTVNIIILFIFVSLIGFYYTINLLLMFFTAGLFVFWISQIEFLSTKRYYKNDDMRWRIYFNKGQRLLMRNKPRLCIEMYYNYHTIDESIDNVKLFLLALFIDNNTMRFIQLYKRNEIDSDIFLIMFKYSLLKENENEYLKKILDKEEDMDLLIALFLYKDTELELYQKYLNMLKNSKNHKILRILNDL